MISIKNKLLFFFSFHAVACAEPTLNNNDDWNGFDPSALEIAWSNGDSAEVNKWIVSLSDTNLSDSEFYSRVSYLSNITGFCYGNADPSEKGYWEIPEYRRKLEKRNVAKVYHTYRQSCLFMKKTSWEETLFIQDSIGNDSIDLQPEELKRLNFYLDSLCR